MKDIFAIIVTYNPQLENLLSLVKQLNSQKCNAIIIDNSKESSLIELSLNESVDCKIISLGENKGIAAAQNIGIQHALSHKAKKIIFFDQDSSISEEFINKLSSYIDDKCVNIVGPTFIDRDKGHYYPICHVTKKGLRKKIIISKDMQAFTTSITISSGTMVTSELLEKVGGMSEDLFIDYVDTEWCLRCFQFGELVHVLPEVTMVHAIGDNSIKILGVNVPVHSPLRRYYRVRNSFLLLRYDNVPKLLCFREIIFSFIHTAIIICTQKRKYSYLKYYFKGLFDGVMNKKGAIDESR
ncbi:rhamnosyltransferase [Pantoea sp. 1.19]|uniref:rhamnosyltransferase n=1 Tax=Pantoea sp. 1.19 TaxID=1925589 RepID=UPI001F0A7DF0|nr:rhamnosyltransferase [Pantoea sp. 1.19]